MSANLSIELNLDDEICTDWGENFSQIVKDAVEYEIKSAVKRAMNDKQIKDRVTKFVMEKMKDKLDELNV